jgi:hypothetical protein
MMFSIGMQIAGSPPPKQAWHFGKTLTALCYPPYSLACKQGLARACESIVSYQCMSHGHLIIQDMLARVP